MTIATRKTFLGGVQRRYGTLDLPVLGQTVRYQSLTERETAAFELASEWKRDELGNLYRDEAAVEQTRGRLIVACLVDAEGNRLLSEADLDQVLDLDGKDIRLLFGTLQVHCNLVGKPEEKKSDSGNSVTTNGSCSPAVSPVTAESPTSTS
jgi:hypothetical protein